MIKWRIKPTNPYNRGYKHLSSEVKQRIIDALKELSQKDNPRHLGLHKYGDWYCVYSYEIGNQYRILYGVDDGNREIHLFEVGTHKVY